MRCNVDLLKIIQLGLTFLDEKGDIPETGPSTWQFNFKFNLTEDMYAEDSVDLLQNSGIQFEKHEQDHQLRHVCIPLLGQFKTEIGEDKYVAVIANTTRSGIQVRKWVERLVWLLLKEQKQHIAGPAFCTYDGAMIRAFELNGEFHTALRAVQNHRPDLLPDGVDIEGSYGTFRSMRRGSLTRATEEGVKDPDMDLINCWRKFEDNSGSKPHLSMREHYLEVKLVLKRMLNYSRAL